MQKRSLCDLAPGERGTVTALTADAGMRRRLLDIGFIPGTPVTCIGRSPFGDPAAYLIRGTVIAIRKKDGRTVRLDREANRP
ncbi:MAG: ferrous iron transport protein A [Clostridia bacterium]|nr:ferrous iron transport protein A [Clostridia bacterium]